MVEGKDKQESGLELILQEDSLIVNPGKWKRESETTFVLEIKPKEKRIMQGRGFVPINLSWGSSEETLSTLGRAKNEFKHHSTHHLNSLGAFHPSQLWSAPPVMSLQPYRNKAQSSWPMAVSLFPCRASTSSLLQVSFAQVLSASLIPEHTLPSHKGRHLLPKQQGSAQ